MHPHQLASSKSADQQCPKEVVGLFKKVVCDGFFIFFQTIWVSMQENLSSVFANNKGADKPAHLRSLNSAFVIR